MTGLQGNDDNQSFGFSLSLSLSPSDFLFRAIDELISSVSFLASKILDTHILLLSPVFGTEAILGVPAGAAQRLGRVGTTISAGSVLSDEDRASSASKKVSGFMA